MEYNDKMMSSINVGKTLIFKDFCYLFEQVPLNEDERTKVQLIYWPLYNLFLSKGNISPEESWVATKNVFIAQEDQIAKRISTLQ